MAIAFRPVPLAAAIAPALIAAPALAQTEAPGALAVAGSLALVTDYRFRGVSRSGGDPAIQGLITVNHASGLYAGVWSSSISSPPISSPPISSPAIAAPSLVGRPVRSSQELDLYAGYTREILPGLTADAGLQYYAFPGSRGGRTAVFEPFATLSRTYGPARIKLGVHYAWNQRALADPAGVRDDNLYLKSDLDVAVPGTPLTLTGHLGYQDGALAGPAVASAALGSGGPYKRHGWDFAVGATATVRGRITLGLSFVGVEGPVVNRLTDDQVVGTLTISF